MEDIGLPPEKLKILGNLKFDTAAGKAHSALKPPGDLIPKDRIIFICGSTHPGEEKVLINCYNEVIKTHPELFLIIAPRDTTRSTEIHKLATAHDLTTLLRSDNSSAPANILILDTIGELILFYALANIGFVGGSLVKKGGQNPIEPATMGLPVIFGPNMQDFNEVANALILAGGATEVSGHQELTNILNSLLTNKELRAQQGRAAQQCVEGQRGVIKRHLELISQLL